MGNIITDWLMFRFRSRARSAQLLARAKAGKAIFGAADKAAKGAKARAKGLADSAGAAKAKGGGDEADNAQDDSQEKTKGKKGKMGLFGKKKGEKAASQKTCPAGHVLDPSWDQCPYCAKQPQAPRAGTGLAGGDKTVAIRINVEEPLEVVGWLVALNGNHRGQDFRLHTGKNVVGTAADCDIVITDPYLSARHATIRHDYSDGSFTVIDNDSTNGTFLNGKRITKDELIDNDTLRLGRTEFKFKALF